MSFFAVIYTITAIFLPHYIPVYFYIQHVSLFLFASMLVYYFISLGYKRFRKYFKRKQILYGYSVLLFGLALYLISDMQAYIIDTYQVSNYESCLYYDENGLLLYNSQMTGCADFEILEYHDTFIKYRATEEDESILIGSFLDIESEYDYRFKVKLLVDVEMTYDEQGRVITGEIKKSQNILVYNEEEEYRLYNSIVVHVVNEYTETTFVSTQTKRIVPSQYVAYQDYDVVLHREELLEEEVISIQGVEIGGCGDQVRVYSDSEGGLEEMYGFYVNNEEPSVVLGTPTDEECDFGHREHTYTFGEVIEYNYHSDPDATGRVEKYADKMDITFEMSHDLPHHIGSLYQPLPESETKETRYVDRYSYGGDVYLTYRNYYNVIKDKDIGYKVIRRNLYNGAGDGPRALPLQLYDIWPVVDSFHIQDYFQYYHRIGEYYMDYPNSFYDQNPLIEFIKEYALEH